MTHTIFAIMSESGSGKTSIVEELEKLGYKSLQSYATRPPRYEGETGHTFVTDTEYEQFKANDEIVAYTYFNDYHYFSTKEQIYNNDLYIIDPAGIEYLKEKVEDIKIVTIYIDVDTQTRIDRMLKRGDTMYQVLSRIDNDRIKFLSKPYDYRVLNYDLDEAVEKIDKIIKSERL